MRRLVLLVALLAIVTAAAAEGEPAPTKGFEYRFRIVAVGHEPVEFTGEFEVDGKKVSLAPTLTPYEFRCEAATSLRGAFVASRSDREIRVRAYLYEVSSKRSVGKAQGHSVGIDLKGQDVDGKHRHTLVLWGEGAP